MSKEQLSESHVKKAFCPPSQNSVDLIDGNGLLLRVSRNGVKSWRYRYQIDGATKILTFGNYPTISLKDARKLRDQAVLLRRAGVDHSTELPVIQQSRPEPVSVSEPAKDKGPLVTFRDVVDEYVKTLASKPSEDEVKRALYKDLVPVWGKRDPESITLREAVLLLDKIAKRAPVLADRLYAYLKRAYTVSIRRGLITINPLVNVQKPAPEAEIRNNSDKVLTLEELQALVECISQNPPSMMDDVLMMILWTGARPSEVLIMQWRQIDGAKRTQRRVKASTFNYPSSQ